MFAETGTLTSLVNQLVALKAGIVGGWFILLCALETLLPRAPRPGLIAGCGRQLKNAALLALNALASPLFVVPLTALASAHPLWQRDLWLPDWLVGWPELALDLLLLDAWIYAWHRLNHALPLFWRFHRVHHLDERLDVSSGVRFHVGEVFLSALMRMPVVMALAVPIAHVLLFEVLILLASLFQHSNLRLPARLEAGLRLVIVTPAHHWVHHHRDFADSNSNYGTVLSLWDRLFGTLSPTRRWPEMPIGLDDRPDLPLAGLLIEPARARPRALPATRRSLQ